jgi:hypothetical protein
MTFAIAPGKMADFLRHTEEASMSARTLIARNRASTALTV